MKEKLINMISELRENKDDIKFFDEASTKQGIILKILSLLDWNPFDVNEVQPEYALKNGGRVDYSLNHKKKSLAFIEVKKPSESLDKHQEQLLNYAFREGIKLAILTNGISWWFYLPLKEGTWDQRKFYTIEIYDQDVNDITDKFISFLSKEHVISGKAIENAENIYNSNRKDYLIEKTLSKAWIKILSKDETLVDILANTTEKICGYKPSEDVVRNFLNNILHDFISNNSRDNAGDETNWKYLTKINPTGKKITAFIFKNKLHNVKTWKDLYVTVIEIIASEQKDAESKFLSLHKISSNKSNIRFARPWFSYKKDSVYVEKIKGTNLYADITLGSGPIIKRVLKMLHTFGYKEDDIKVMLEQSN